MAAAVLVTVGLGMQINKESAARPDVAGYSGSQCWSISGVCK